MIFFFYERQSWTGSSHFLQPFRYHHTWSTGTQGAVKSAVRVRIDLVHQAGSKWVRFVLISGGLTIMCNSCRMRMKARLCFARQFAGKAKNLRVKHLGTPRFLSMRTNKDFCSAVALLISLGCSHHSSLSRLLTSYNGSILSVTVIKLRFLSSSLLQKLLITITVGFWVWILLSQSGLLWIIWFWEEWLVENSMYRGLMCLLLSCFNEDRKAAQIKRVFALKIT